MSLSDCVKCWNTPCTCGWEYRDWARSYRISLAATILGIDEKHLETLTDIEGKLIIPELHPLRLNKTKLV